MSEQHSNETLQSGVLTSAADELLGRAIASALAAPPLARAEVFEALVLEIAAFMAARPEERPWTCTVFTGTDGSRVFRGGVGHSLVVDPAGSLWRARSYEDFVTTYEHTATSCEVATLTPLYTQMSEYRPR